MAHFPSLISHTPTQEDADKIGTNITGHRFSTFTPENPFVLVYGRDTNPTRLLTREICRNHQHKICQWSTKCYRIHLKGHLYKFLPYGTPIKIVGVPWDSADATSQTPTPPQDENAPSLSKQLSTATIDDKTLQNDDTSATVCIGKSTVQLEDNSASAVDDTDTASESDDSNDMASSSSLSQSTSLSSVCTSEDVEHTLISKTTDQPQPGNLDKPLEVCRQWSRGFCFRASSCRYLHPDVQPSHTPLPESSVAMLASRQVTSTWTLPIREHMRVKMGGGFKVLEIKTGFESSWLILGNIPRGVSLDEIRSLLSTFGQLLEVVLLPAARSASHLEAKAHFSSVSEAQAAVMALNGTEQFGRPVSLRISTRRTRGPHFQDASVQILWERPSVTAYVGYRTFERAQQAVLMARTRLVRNVYVSAVHHKGLPAVGRFTVKFQYLPLDAMPSDIEEFGEPEDTMWEKPNYPNAFKAPQGIQRILEMNGLKPSSFDVLQRTFNDAYTHAWAIFATPSAAKDAVNTLHQRKPACTGRTRIYAKHVYSLTYSISLPTLDTIRGDVMDLQDSAWRSGFHDVSVVFKRCNNGTAQIRIAAQGLRHLGDMKREFEHCLYGEVLQQWHAFFTRADGILFLRHLEKTCVSLTIQANSRRRNIRLVGPRRQRLFARESIKAKLSQLQQPELRSISLPGDLLGTILVHGLGKLYAELGTDNIKIDLWNKQLNVYGSQGDFRLALRIIDQVKAQVRGGRQAHGSECPVCFNAVTAPVTMRCGHAYCRTCLKNYIIAATNNRYFPLACLGNEAKCAQTIPLALARELLSPADFAQVVEAAFFAHVDQHPKTFFYCPSADCFQVYRAAPEGTVLQCPSCILRICSTCHGEEHLGFSCPDGSGGDAHLQKWIENHDVKKCPGCKTNIERAAGCNHVTCTICKTHICWVCLKTFPGGDGIYAHMSLEHGGFGLDPMVTDDWDA